MDKIEQFYLLEQNNKAMIAINSGDPQKIADEVNSLIRMVNMKAGIVNLNSLLIHYRQNKNSYFIELELFQLFLFISRQYR